MNPILPPCITAQRQWRAVSHLILVPIGDHATTSHGRSIGCACDRGSGRSKGGESVADLAEKIKARRESMTVEAAPERRTEVVPVIAVAEPDAVEEKPVTVEEPKPIPALRIPMPEPVVKMIEKTWTSEIKS